jgi:hypothetical protein
VIVTIHTGPFCSFSHSIGYKEMGIKESRNLFQNEQRERKTFKYNENYSKRKQFSLQPNMTMKQETPVKIIYSLNTKKYIFWKLFLYLILRVNTRLYLYIFPINREYRIQHTQLFFIFLWAMLHLFFQYINPEDILIKTTTYDIGGFFYCYFLVQVE